MAVFQTLRSGNEAVRIDRGDVMLYVRGAGAQGVDVELRVNGATLVGRKFSSAEWSDLLAAVKTVGRAFNLGETA